MLVKAGVLTLGSPSAGERASRDSVTSPANPELSTQNSEHRRFAAANPGASPANPELRTQNAGPWPANPQLVTRNSLTRGPGVTPVSGHSPR